MKRLLTVVLLLWCCMTIAATSQVPLSLVGKAPAIEIAELEDMIAKAKANGQTPDPAWTTRIRELIPLVKGHASKVPADLPVIQADRGFAPGAVIRQVELTRLEQQIKELEFQIDGGFSSVEPDEITRLNLKDQLNDLYSQRVVRDPANPLDQGNDTCPATPINGLPYTDTGTTSGRANNFSPAQIGGACFNNNAPDVIYSFVPPYTQSYTITTDGSSYDTYIYIQRFGTCPGDSTLECNDDGGIGVNSLITRTLTAGVTYHIIVDGYASSSGNYVLNVFDNCNIECQPGDIQECFEVRDSTHLQNNCNGGCENPLFGGVESWQDIQPCQTVCGRLFTGVRPNGGNYRDVDTYRFTLTEACSLAITLNSEVGYTLTVTTASCPWSFLWTYTSYPYPCSTATHVTPCFQPGTYSVMVRPNTFTGINDFRTYRMQVGLIPCSGCQIDAFIQAPGSGAWHTCGAGNDNNLRPSEDYTFCVNIPQSGEWTFSTCNDDSIWDSYIYLSNQCNGSVIAEDDDACGGIGLSVINCVELQAGTYYLTVEGWSSSRCGPFVLNVFECVGSCCYGNPGNPSCAYIGPNACDSLGGSWTNLEPCSTGACYTRPECGEGEIIFSQLPFLPDEAGTGLLSHVDYGTLYSDNYSVNSVVGSVHFWGFPVFCNGAPETFLLTFGNGTDTCQYTVTATGAQFPQLYFGSYLVSQYEVEISPPCELLSGNLTIQKLGDPSCLWYWATSPFGDNIRPVAPNYEFAFCLDQAPCEIDSLTYIWNSPGIATLRWYQNLPGVVTIWYTTDPNAIYPAGYSFVTNPYPAGNNSLATNANLADNVRVVLTLNCTPNSAAALPPPPKVLNLSVDSQE